MKVTGYNPCTFCYDCPNCPGLWMERDVKDLNEAMKVCAEWADLGITSISIFMQGESE